MPPCPLCIHYRMTRLWKNSLQRDNFLRSGIERASCPCHHNTSGSLKVPIQYRRSINLTELIITSSYFSSSLCSSFFFYLNILATFLNQDTFFGFGASGNLGFSPPLNRSVTLFINGMISAMYAAYLGLRSSEYDKSSYALHFRNKSS